MSKRLALLALLILASSSAFASDGADTEKGREFFERKIRPVLNQHCLECHSATVGKKVAKGGLRLDDREALRTGGDNGSPIEPGKPDESLLIEVLRYRDAVKMPPKGKLPDAVVADFETWIKLGAPDPREPVAAKTAAAKKVDPLRDGLNHWAYQPLRTVPTPQPKDSRWSGSMIDAFLRDRQEKAGLTPVAEADRATLIRRLSFDLTGLPPTPEEIAAFEADHHADAYERLVERLLASKAFGERWGRHWLDIARFGESLTLRGLIYKDAWRYRDFVIATFNADRPIDQFIREQVAGDLLSASTLPERRGQLIATAYLAIGNANLEEQDKVQLRMDVVDEQLDVISKGLLAQTITCARCHDHKFDPIPTRDYYALAGILRNAKAMEHANVSNWINRPLPMEPELQAAADRAERQIARLEAEIKTERDKAKRSGSLAVKGVVAITSLPGVAIDDSRARRVGSWTLSRFSGSYIGEGYLHDENSGKGQKTLTFQPDNLPPGTYELRLAYTPGSNRATNVPVTVMSAEGEANLTINERQTPPIDGRFVSLGKFRFEKDGLAYVLVSNEGTDGHVIADAVQFLSLDKATTPKPAAGAGAKPDALAKLEAELKRIKDAAPKRDQVPSVVEEKTIEDARIHIRGSVHTLGDLVPRGFLKVATPGPVPPLPSAESGRKELADWLTSPQNPLTARVYVNRVWHWLMGAGLVRTTDNFGTTGEPPSHPELLDKLALQFMNEGWSTKRLIRAIVLSKAYRLSSNDDAKNRSTDPENRLLWRANRRRLEAECLRDAMLAASGRLHDFNGGSTFPDDLASDYGFQSKQEIRSVYLPAFRNAMPEFLENFDAADPSVVTGRRNQSTVAPQALFLMNHPFVIEQSRAVAHRLLTEPLANDPARLDRLYLLVLGRPASPREREVAVGFMKKQTQTGSARAEDVWAMLAQAVFASPEFRMLD